MNSVKPIIRQEDGNIIVTTSDIMFLFSITDATLANWVKSGCPKVERGAFNLREVIRWRGIAKQGDDYNEESSEAKKLHAEADYKHAKARQEEVKLQEMLGNLVPIEMIKDKLSMTFTEIRQTLLKLPNDIRVAVHTQYPDCSEEVTSVAEESVRKCLVGLAECGYAGTNSTLERFDREQHQDSTEAVQSTTQVKRKRVGRPKKSTVDF